MADPTETTSDRDLPHVIENEEDSSSDVPSSDRSGTSNLNSLGAHNYEIDGRDLNYRQFSPGFSDDEDSGRTFMRDWPRHQARRQATNATRGEKSLRHSDDADTDAEPDVRAKKPRQSLFGGAETDVDDEEQAGIAVAPATSGPNMGNRMSTLSLDPQQSENEHVPRNTSTGFGLACSDIGSVRDSPTPSDDDEVVIPPDPIPYYELRQNIDRNKAITHVDTDRSGNWDPDQDAKDRTQKLVQIRLAKKRKKDKREKKRGKIEKSKKHKPKWIAKLHFQRFGDVRNATNDEQNWPKGYSDIDSEQDRESKEKKRVYRNNTPTRAPQMLLKDPADRVDDLTGYPAARGCKSCRKLDKLCSMVKGGAYPCEKCRADDEECQHIQEPQIKGRCERCEQSNEPICSFENDSTQPICDICADKDYICKALPPNGYKAPRISIDEVIHGPDRLHVACASCRTLGKRCSLKSKQDSPPCKNCSKNNIGCTFFNLPEPEKPARRKPAAKGKTAINISGPDTTHPRSEFFTEEDLANMHRRKNTIPRREPTPELEMEDTNGNKGMLTKIITSFAHPIRFTTEAAVRISCNFCEIPAFGMVGNFEREVHVIRWHNGLGYTEIGGGHGQTAGDSTMCKTCLGNRLQVLACTGHTLEPLPDSSISFDALMDELFASEPGCADTRFQLSRWCSMCFSPAAFGCSTTQADLCSEQEAKIPGCHLRLCFACEVALRITYAGDSDAMATELDKQPKISEADEVLGKQLEGRPRADVGFLRLDGLLMRYIQAEG